MRRMLMIVLGSVLSLVCGCSLAAPVPDLSCAKYAATRAKLDQIYAKYEALPKTAKNAENLFQLYQRLKQIGDEAHALYPDYAKHLKEYIVISNCLVDPRFSEIGVRIGHYSDRLEYSEKLMADAHRLNPNTRYRKYTLYTEVLGGNIGDDLMDLPNVESANQYLKEFPDGPYATAVHLTLAGFYHDLFQSLRFGESQMGESNYCYVEYISHHPSEAGVERARKLAIMHFEQVIDATPPEDANRKDYIHELGALKSGKPDNVTHWCTD